MASSVVVKSASKEELSQKVGEAVLKVVEDSKGSDAPFLVALSGGSLPKLLAAGLLAHTDKIDFSKWHVFFADERYVAHTHEDSNLLACKEAFLDKVPIPQDNIYGIDMSKSLAESALAYQEDLSRVSGIDPTSSKVPRFDLVLLGMGPDGHTCSLFPGHSLLDESKLWVASIDDSPKPPPQRITLTYPVLDNAKNVFFLAAGSSKAEVLPKVTVSLEELEKMGSSALPAARVRPENGNLIWFVDDAAAAKL
eukprot:CAMPEP_0184011858 /NCGR_PEP_ID=MMETSP0954-20121128/4060_1 /TAXON_ID=627963 /ORGANISM="Aplanochytrium sp, Strain PBS07" /LENGTH=251 /DNA_ID=CAMNT_0026291721 /DNA_START=208 /DNA_END=963 /DNA_ORIENTATION=+